MDGQLFNEFALGYGFGFPFVFELAAELFEMFGVLKRQDGGGGTETVLEGVEANGLFAFDGGGSGGVLRVPDVGLVLFVGNHGLSFRPEGNAWAGLGRLTGEVGGGSGC